MGSMANFPWERSTRKKLDRFQKTLHSGWRRKVAKPISNVDSFVKHVYRAHSQETDHWANIGVQERRKIIIDRRNDSATWKAIRGFWDGSFKDNGRSGCGVVIKGSSDSGCGYGSRDCWCVRAHEYPRFRSSANAWVFKTSISVSIETLNNWLSVHVHVGFSKSLCPNFRACLWTTLRAFVDGQTCLWLTLRNYGNTTGVPPALFQLAGHRDVIAQSFVTCSGSWIRKWWLMTAQANRYLWQPERRGIEKTRWNLWLAGHAIITVWMTGSGDGGQIEFEWTIFPRTCFIGDRPKDPKRSAISKHWTWRIWRSNSLHVYVQWHPNGQRKEHEGNCISNSEKVKMYAKRLVLARTLEIPWLWRGTEVVWK